MPDEPKDTLTPQENTNLNTDNFSPATDAQLPTDQTSAPTENNGVAQNTSFNEQPSSQEATRPNTFGSNSFIVPTQPQFQPQATVSTPDLPAPVPNNPITLVLQWLTYAFWGWTVLSLSILTSISIGHFMMKDAHGDFGGSMISYALAAVIVLFIISAVSDAVYTKREPEHKQGAATVIMIIHAVIFALFAIGWVIAAVFAVLSLFLGSDDGNEGALTTLMTGIIIAFVYGITMVRTLRPKVPKKISLYYTLLMALITLAIATLGIAGPAMNARLTKDDRLIEQGLYGISKAINDYADDNNKLPSNLDDIKDDTSTTSKELITRNLVEYNQGGTVDQTESSILRRTTVNSSAGDTDKVFEYELCVEFKAKKGTSYSHPENDSDRRTYPDTYSHGKGRVCYDLVTDNVY